MQPLPNLPTDNLYKFLALTGVLIVLLSTAAAWREADRSQVLVREMKHLMALSDAKVEIAGRTAPITTTTEALKSYQELNYRLLESARIDLANVTPLTAELNFILDWKGRYLALFVLGCMIGGTMAGSGFYLWYTRVQKYQDAYIRKQAASVTEQAPQDAALTNTAA